MSSEHPHIQSTDLPYLDAGGKRIRHGDTLQGHVVYKWPNGKSGLWPFSGIVNSIYLPRGHQEVQVGFGVNGVSKNIIRFTGPAVREVFISFQSPRRKP